MLKLLWTAVAAGMVLVWIAPDDAAAQSRGYRSKSAKKVHAYRYYGRPASVGPDGLCQRDTGTPTGQLNFRNRCDTEEFWNRTMQGGRRR